MHSHPWARYHASGDPSSNAASPSSISESLEHAVANYKNRVALDLDGKHLTYAQLGRKVQALAQGLLDSGVRRGDRVAIVLPMCFESVIAFHATLRIGAVAVMHSANAPMAQLSRFFNDYHPSAAIVVDNRIDALGGIDRSSAPKSVISVPRPDTAKPQRKAGVSGTLSSLAVAGGRTIVRTAMGSPGPTPRAHAFHCTPWKGVLASPPLHEHTPFPGPNDLAVILYPERGGASPMGAMLTHENLVAFVEQSLSWLPDSKPGTETSYAMWPLHSAIGIANTMTTSLIHGRRTILFPHYTRSALLKALKKHPPTVVAADSSVFKVLAELVSEGVKQATHVKFAFTRLEHMDQASHRIWNEALGRPVVVGYSSAESVVISGLPLWSSGHDHSVGVPFPSTHVRIVDPDDPGRILPNGRVGQLMVKGPQVFHGYWNKPDETSAVLTPDGWLLTNDLASLDEDGFVTLERQRLRRP